MLNFAAGNRRKLLKFLSVQLVSHGSCSKVSTVVGVINRFIPAGYVQLACRISFGSKFTGLDLDLETVCLGLEDLWPWPPQYCPRTHPCKLIVSPACGHYCHIEACGPEGH